MQPKIVKMAMLRDCGRKKYELNTNITDNQQKLSKIVNKKQFKYIKIW